MAYRERNRVERLIRGLQQHRRVAPRYETSAGHHVGMLVLGALLRWL